MHLSMYEKKHSLSIDLSKFSKIMHHYAFFSELCADRAELCNFVSAHSSRSPQFYCRYLNQECEIGVRAKHVSEIFSAFQGNQSKHAVTPHK